MLMISFQAKVIAAVSALMAAICIVSVICFGNVYASLQRDELTAELDYHLKIQSEILAIPLWELDHRQVERLSKAIGSDEHLAYVGVWAGTDQATAPFAEYGSDEKDGFDLSGNRKIAEPGGEAVIGLLKLVVSGRETAHAIEMARWVGLVVGLVVFGVSIGIVIFGFYVFTRPLRALTQVMQRLSASDVDVTVPAIYRTDEIGDLARSVNVFREHVVKVRDMTQALRDHAQLLEEALANEKELNGLQRQFVSMVSHEFRTPLAIIDGSAQRLLRRLDRLTPERVRDIMLKVRHSVTRLTELMESVLDAARLEEGRIAFGPGDCNIKATLTDLASSYDEIHPDHHISLDIDSLPAQIFADEKLLRQVFSNLLSNAVKYAPDGRTIRIDGRRDEATNDILVSVRDEGIGIPEAELAKLFDRFFRASTSTGIPGTGIGLHLVKHFVDLHEGTIDVTSKEGEGTTFTVCLPSKKIQSMENGKEKQCLVG